MLSKNLSCRGCCLAQGGCKLGCSSVPRRKNKCEDEAGVWKHCPSARAAKGRQRRRSERCFSEAVLHRIALLQNCSVSDASSHHKGFFGGSFSRPAGGSCCWGGVIAEGAAEHPRVTGMLSKPEGSQQKSSQGCCISLPFAGAGGDSTVTAEQHQPLPARSHHVLPCLLL